MFGFSVSKILVLVAVILAVWYGFKLLSRLEAARKDEKIAARRAPRRRSSGRAGSRSVDEAEEMRECAICKAFVPLHGATNCGRPDCPR